MVLLLTACEQEELLKDPAARLAFFMRLDNARDRRRPGRLRRIARKNQSCARTTEIEHAERLAMERIRRMEERVRNSRVRLGEEEMFDLVSVGESLGAAGSPFLPPRPEWFEADECCFKSRLVTVGSHQRRMVRILRQVINPKASMKIARESGGRKVGCQPYLIELREMAGQAFRRLTLHRLGIDPTADPGLAFEAEMQALWRRRIEEIWLRNDGSDAAAEDAREDLFL